MDTDKYIKQILGKKDNQSNAEIPSGQPGNIRRDIIRKKKEKISKIKEFLDLKVKIHNLIKLNKYDQARDTYQTLYPIYQDLLKIATSAEAAKLQKDLSIIYTKLLENLQKKRVKGIQEDGNIPIEKTTKEDRIKRKVITTDFDMIMKIIEENGKMTLGQIESQFNISRTLAEEWVQILADYGLVEIRYMPIGGIEVSKIKKDKSSEDV